MDDATLTRRLCELLGAVPTWHWSEVDPPPAGAVGVFAQRIPLDAPDRAIAVRVYAPQDETFLSQRRVQLRIRGARDVWDDASKLADIALPVMTGVSRHGGILGAQRLSFDSQGPDTNGREQRTENYLITLDNVEA